MKTCTQISQKSGGTPREWVGIGIGLVWMLIDADNADAELAVLETDINGQVAWEVFSETLPVAALGKNVKFEFSYISGFFNLGPYPGWYIDDVEVTVP